jgi:hypothetical protein
MASWNSVPPVMSLSRKPRCLPRSTQPVVQPPDEIASLDAVVADEDASRPPEHRSAPLGRAATPDDHYPRPGRPPPELRDHSVSAGDIPRGPDLTTALEYGKAIEHYGLFWYEEVGDPLDYALNATLAEHYSGPIATGENLFSLQDARNLIRYGGLRPDRDFIQVDPALSYGLVEYLRIQDMLRQHGWSSRRCIPHGGHQFSLHITAALKRHRLRGQERLL